MAVNAEFNRKHPRHKENGRFREKNGSDATAYARRISAKIAASRGGGSSGRDAKTPTDRVRQKPAHEQAYDKAISAGDSAAAMRAVEAANPEMTDGQKATARKHIAEAIGHKTSGPSSRSSSGGELGKAKRAAHANGAQTKAEIDANLHKRYKDATVAELRAIIKALAVEHRDKKPGSMGNPAIGDSLARLIEKKTGA